MSKPTCTATSIFVYGSSKPLLFAYSEICLKRSLKIDKTNVLKTIGSLMKVESIAEFCITFDMHLSIIGLENHFEWPLKTGLLFAIRAKWHVLAQL